jgi:hypothetical protein
VEKIYSFCYENPGVSVQTLGSGVSGNMFKNNQALMIPGWLISATEGLRDMTADYSIIPYPKYDEAQEKYLARIQDGVSLLCLPVNCTKTEAVCAFLEAMASESYKNLSPVYFDTAMKVKYARDETASKVLDIIREGAYLNFAGVYNESIGYPWFVLRQLMPEKSSNFASWYEKNEPVINSALEKLVTQIQSAE